MAKLTRETLIQFGKSGAPTVFGQFGSKLAGLPQTSQDPAVLQALAAWVQGWQSAVVAGDKAGYLEDMNGWCFVHSYMMAYLYQQGIPEWDGGTEYYANSVVQGTVALGNAGQWFNSLQDNNTGNAPPVGASNAFWEWVNEPAAAVPLVGNSLKASLTVAPNGGAPGTKVDVAADLLSVQGVTLSAVSETGDISVSGANGLDTGAAANSTWYAVHVICNAAGTLVASLFSLSATAPTLPIGYTLFRRVGWVRRDGGGIFRFFTQVGDWVYYKTPIGVASPTGTTSFASDVPTTSKLADFNTTATGFNFSSNNYGALQFTTTGEANPVFVMAGDLGTGGAVERLAGQFQFRTNASQQVDITQIFLNNCPWTVTVMGYYDPI